MCTDGVRSTQAVNRPNTMPAAKNGTSGRTSRRQSIRPRFHQNTTSSAAGSVAVTDLASSASRKERECYGIERAAAARVEPEVGERRGKIQHAGERVLELGDPRDRLDVHGVEREQDAGEDGSWHGQASKQEGEEETRPRVETDVDDVIAERVPPQS